ncbi:arsenate reductase [Novosphingobium sp. M1R2S20]|uniref:Arsenate reductase n=1 Tax=Novosphingobium rhizovicinum TaxID=3228928 RepID=A0ABV3RDF3_9SPHN
MMLQMFGIPNCDTVKKARAWLDERGLAYAFHDYKKEGAQRERLAQWTDQADWEALLNRRGTTFRKLPEADKVNLDAEKAISLMAANPSSIKRPVVEYPGGLLVGFDPCAWEQALS